MSSLKLIGILVNFHQNWNKNLMKFFDQSYQISTFNDQIQANAFLVILGPDSNFRRRKSEVSGKKYLARCH